MRCPYCGGLNPNQVEYCVRCGRDVSLRPPVVVPSHPSQHPQPTYPGQQQHSSQQRPVQQPQQRPVYSPGQPPQPQPQPQPQRAPATPKPARPVAVSQADTQAAIDKLAPPTYPPRTMDQLQDLEKLALPYRKLNESSEVGHKRIIHIAYQRCHPWQQMATLLKASKEFQNLKFDTLIIRGLLDQAGATNLYDYTNGQLILDRNVRLGNQIQNRYQISTGSGLDVGSVRVVLSEE